MCLTANNWIARTKHLQPLGKTTNYENGIGHHRKRRDTDGQKEREREGGCSAL